MNLLTLSDAKLGTFLDRVTVEIDRRTMAATEGHDPASVVHGNETAKRALIVAAAGRHSILFVGSSHSGKTMLRAVALELGLSTCFEARPCPCDRRSDPTAQCRCTARQIDRHFSKLPPVDITVATYRPTDRDRERRGTTLADMTNQIATAASHGSLDFDGPAEGLLRAAVREMGLAESVRQRILRVSRTIANLDRTSRIETSHVAEALNYRPLGR